MLTYIEEIANKNTWEIANKNTFGLGMTLKASGCNSVLKTRRQPKGRGDSLAQLRQPS